MSWKSSAHFCSGRLRDKHGLTVLVPDPPNPRLVHIVINDALCQGIVNEHS